MAKQNRFTISFSFEILGIKYISQRLAYIYRNDHIYCNKIFRANIEDQDQTVPKEQSDQVCNVCHLAVISSHTIKF